jgi:DNA-binding MarR family transcriptional regulator
MADVSYILLRAKRLSLMGALVETYEGQDTRRRVVLQLRDMGVITDDAAETLLEVYGLEAV